MAYKPSIRLDESELIYRFIRSPGPGGQNVNKVATGVLLRFNVRHSPSLIPVVRERLLLMTASQLTANGDLLIKATSFRTQERNKQDALDRLMKLIAQASVIPKKRRATKPTYSSQQKRLNQKKLHGKSKILRQRKPSKDE